MAVNSMICSVCKKNPAVVFVNKIENGKTEVQGLCYNCAKEKGINPLQVLTQNANISEDDIQELSEQFGNFMNELNENGEMDLTGEDEDGKNPFAGILNLFKGNMGEGAEEASAAAGSQDGTSHKKVKVEKKQQKNNKKRFLDTFGTNLTDLALQGKIDEVIGREQEIVRVTQILNRRSKNNPCLIGEPGVGKTAIAQRFGFENCKKRSTS